MSSKFENPTTVRKQPAAACAWWSSFDPVLRSFDLDETFGPCVGISRSERWQRAERLGLQPPIAVKEVINLRPEREHSIFEGRV